MQGVFQQTWQGYAYGFAGSGFRKGVLVAVKPKVGIIVQARMGSTRLPGKVLKELAPGKTALSILLRQLSGCKAVDGLVVATSSQPEDKAILDEAARLGAKAYAGSLDDVLDRFYQVATREKYGVVVRITGDCPLIDPEVVDRVVTAFLGKKGVDYASNVFPPTFPDGLDTEVFSFSRLEEAWKNAKSQLEREHVTPYLHRNPQFSKLNVPCEKDLSAERWTLDRPEDLAFLQSVFRHLPDRIVHYKDVLAVLDAHPQYRAINTHIIRNEKYVDSGKKGGNSMKLEKSKEYLRRAQGLIPCLTQTLSKGPTQFVQGVSPIYLRRGKGSHVWDVDGNEYIDFPLGLGAISLGYGDPEVDAAVMAQVRDGPSFSLMHPLEVEVAEAMQKAIPCAESVRYSKTGSEATSAAVRIARANTGREKIAHCGYHGWHDWHIGGTEFHRGVPESTRKLLLKFKYNDPESLQKLFDENKGEIAAVIMEPIGVVPPEDGFLGKVQKIAHENGALLVFDETVTGFRVSLGGAQEYYKVTPDLATFGKGMGNGYPLSVVAGKREYMQVCENIFFSTTFGGEAVSLAAAKAVIEKMRAKPVLQHVWSMGKRFQDGFNKLATEHGAPCKSVGLPVHNVISWEGTPEKVLLRRSLFLQTPIQKGILLSGGQNFCFAHTPDEIDLALRACDDALKLFMEAEASGTPEKFLQGEPVKPVFRSP